ncbi:hypothetical protein [Campylobacter sp. TTU_617]|uniref:hypothetical protein n=1 Tax=Campylobacter sp. TTU_617 TaxID=2768148 RepID=UPI0019039385|nr:hypothetical protein [Campylobacter sp. TTU_617]MBK1971344.1 hypothetical protein [Campylobacter sp. TTU_617]
MLKKMFLALFCAFLFIACSDKEAPIEISLGERYNPIFKYNTQYLEITSLVDTIEITKITPNRGKGDCRAGGLLDKKDIKIEKTLSYGQS